MEELNYKNYTKTRIMIRITLIACLIIASFMSFAQTDSVPAKLSLQQCLQIALKNNSDVQQKEITAGTAKANWQYAKGFMIPTLNGDANAGIQNGRSIDPYTNSYGNQTIRYSNYSLTSSVTLFNMFAIQHNIKQNKLAFEASEYEIQQQKDFVALNVILQYLQILTNQDLLEAAKQQQEVSARQVERLQILDSAGNIGPNELYDLKGQYAQNQLTVVNAENALLTAKVTLAQLLNIPYDKSREIERLTVADFEPNTMTNTDSIYNTALQNLALVKAAELRKNSAVYSVKSYRSQRYPSLYMNGGLFTNYSSAASTQEYLNSSDIETENYVLDNGSKLPLYVKQDNYAAHKIPYGSQFTNNFNSSISIGISIPLLNNLRNRTQIKTALLQQKSAEINLYTTRTQLQQSVEQSYVNVTTAKERLETLTGQVEAYKESFRVAEIKFNAGAINSVEYLVVKNYFDQANLNLIISKYDYVLRSMALDYYSGKLKFNY